MNLPSDPIFSGLVPLVVLWVTVWIQLAIIPFLGKAEKLFVTFKQSGTIDVALSRIDSEGVVKELTSLFEAAIELQEDKRRRADIERLLSKVEYSDVLERLEQATGKKAKISRSYRSLRAKSTRVWHYGLLHLLLLIGGVAVTLWPAQGDVLRVIAVVVFTLSVITAVVSIASILGFTRDMATLLGLVETGDA